MKLAILFALQMSCIVILAFSGRIFSSNVFLLLTEIIAIDLGYWAFIANRQSKISIMPRPRTGVSLVIDGPYRYIRHPMYTAILLLTLAWTLENLLWWRIVAEGILLTVIVIKLLYEEEMLKDIFSDYKDYMKQTRRLIPFLW